MKRSTLMFAAMPALALLAGCGGTSTTNTTETTLVDNQVDYIPPVANVGNETVAMPMMTGQQFADTAASTDAYEIAAGKLAMTKATSQALKDFGDMMVDNHSDSTAKLKAAAGKASPAIVPNPALTEEQKANLATLEDATGADFDTAYKSQQLAAHQKALGAVQAYAATGEVPEIRAWAAETAPVIQVHLEKIRGM